MASAWIEHVKKFAKKNKVSYKEAMSKAKATYKPMGKAVDKKKPVKKEKKMTKKEKKKMEEENM